MRGIIAFAVAVALVAILIPHPEFKWFSLAALAVIWLATPTSPIRGKGSS